MLVDSPSLSSSALTHRTLLDRLARARAETGKLFDLITPEARYSRPIRERHRIVFYLGHLEAFDWNLLQRAFPNLKSFDPAFDQLFAFGIDPVDSGGLPSDQPSDWPEYSQVLRYAAKIRAALDHALENEAPPQLLNVAIEHRLMHAETLAYMLHRLPYGQKRRQVQPAIAETESPDFDMVQIPDGSVKLGLRANDSQFGWDNEYNAHRVDVPAFSIDRYKISNGQFLNFVESGGYRHREFWTDAAWAWRTQHHIEHPAFWQYEAGAWFYRGMFEAIPLPPHWPVWVSHAEASAYCVWAGKRLPTEAEWQRACYGTGERSFPWGESLPGSEHGYFAGARWDPSPVNAFPASASASGVEGALANGWEWTSSLFAPFTGFKPFPFYEGYSANFFDGMHYVLKGGSPRTGACMLRASFRNWFQPHYPYVYAGFRCAI